MDEILSGSHMSIDVANMIEVLLATVEFEEDLQQRFETGKELPE